MRRQSSTAWSVASSQDLSRVLGCRCNVASARPPRRAAEALHPLRLAYCGVERWAHPSSSLTPIMKENARENPPPVRTDACHRTQGVRKGENGKMAKIAGTRVRAFTCVGAPAIGPGLEAARRLGASCLGEGLNNSRRLKSCCLWCFTVHRLPFPPSRTTPLVAMLAGVFTPCACWYETVATALLCTTTLKLKN